MCAISYVIVLACACAASTSAQTFSIYETAENIRYNGYPAETHHVTTSDGYILEMHRIPHGKGQVYSADRPVVFLMHGLLAASNSFIILGPEFAPAYNLADAGFDIWMGNARGNKNSRHHISLDPNNSTDKFEFFDFSWEEIAIIDLPAMIDYALDHTGKKQLHYIGHSQGGTVFLVLTTMRTEYNEKIASAHLWAGVGYMEHFPHPQLSMLAALTDTIYNLAVMYGWIELFPPEWTDAMGSRQSDKCIGDVQQKYMCELLGVRYLLGEEEAEEEGSEISSAFDNYEIAGAALKQFAHYGQNVRDKTFRRWSYGSVQNLLEYGTTSPPIYDLSLITINVTMHYTVSDNLLDERDVLAMEAVMPNTVVRKVERDTFLHADFVAAKDAKELVTSYVIEALAYSSGLNTEEDIETEEGGDSNSGNSPGNGENNESIEAVQVEAATDSAHHFVLSNICRMYLIVLGLRLLLK